MLARFCIYGFLKNQRYFEPFLVLAFLDKGLTFLQIGVLLAIESVTTNVLEIPSGAIADLFGRRRSLILSFTAYLFSFLAFGWAQSFAALCGAMVLFGVGEAFRTGSHKSLIFAWLKLEGRSDEKTRVYGVTRSWSKFGSASSALIAAVLVYWTAKYEAVFLWSMAPCVLSIVNLLGYPGAIDPAPETRSSVGDVLSHLRATALDILHPRPLRGLIVESMGFHGLFRSTKDYLQPALLAASVVWLGAAEASGMPLEAGAGGTEDPRRAALLVGPVYFVLFVAAGIASRNAHRFAGWAGGEAPAARRLWGFVTCLFLVLAGSSLIFGADAKFALGVTIVGFAILHVLQNLWRPIMTSRIYGQVDEKKGATVLSVESQGQRLATIVLAPLFGYLVDQADRSFWSMAAVAGGLAAWFFVRRPVDSRV